MKGLLVKDFCIIAKNKKMLGILFFLTVFVFILPNEDMGSFIISYATILGGSLVLSTISTDEFDKSTIFLMTMPISKRTYALEKYAFSFLCSITCWAVSTTICCILAGSGAMDLLKAASAMLAVLSLFQFIMIPVQLKFGGENGRMVLLGMVVMIFAVGFIIKKVMMIIFRSEEAVSLWLQGVIRWLDELKPLPVVMIIIAGLAVCFAVSAGISIRAVEKREF